MRNTSNDFSLFALFAAGLAALTSAQAVYTGVKPVGAAPTGNSITRPLLEVVPAGAPFEITWTPTPEITGDGPVTLILLRGPGDNLVYLETIAEHAPNTGKFTWQVSDALEPDTTRYGIQLIVEANGMYQYTTQFGISNPSYNPSAKPSGTNATMTLSATASSDASTMIPSTTIYSTGGVPANSSIVLPTKSMSVPSSLIETATATAAGTTGGAGATQTPSGNAAVRLGAGLGAVVGAVVVGLVL